MAVRVHVNFPVLHVFTRARPNHEDEQRAGKKEPGPFVLVDEQTKRRERRKETHLAGKTEDVTHIQHIQLDRMNIYHRNDYW